MVSLLHVTVTFGASNPVPAPASEVRSGNSPLSAPQITGALDSLESDVAVVVVVAIVVVTATVVVLVVLAAFFTLAVSEDEPQADTSTRPKRARAGNIRFCITTLCMKYTKNARST